jgi:hypothetical protein
MSKSSTPSTFVRSRAPGGLRGRMVEHWPIWRLIGLEGLRSGRMEMRKRLFVSVFACALGFVFAAAAHLDGASRASVGPVNVAQATRLYPSDPPVITG